MKHNNIKKIQKLTTSSFITKFLMPATLLTLALLTGQAHAVGAAGGASPGAVGGATNSAGAPGVSTGTNAISNPDNATPNAGVPGSAETAPAGTTNPSNSNTMANPNNSMTPDASGNMNNQ